MKFRNSVIILLLLALALLGACGGGQNGESGDDSNGADSPVDGLYSNLLDEESRELLGAAMETAGIGPVDIELFFRQVDLFNNTVNGYGLVEEGFKYPVAVEPDYDPYEMQDIFYENSHEFMGYNCRITSYELIRSLIQIGNPFAGDTNIIIFDEESIINGPEEILSDVELKEFKALYSAVPTENTKDVSVHVANVKKDWAEKQISFAGDDGAMAGGGGSGSTKASLISVFFHENGEEEPYLFIGHVGILVQAVDGDGFYFIEKIAFQEPYQAIRFYDKAKLKDYLLEKYDLSWGQDTAKAFVMENGELMIK